MNNAGTEWIVDAAGCDPDRLRDVVLLRRICDDILVDMRLQAVDGPLWRKFPPPGGVTGLYLLAESHLACHTRPELGVATFNAYCTSARPEWSWTESLKRDLGATAVVVWRVERATEAIAQAGRTPAS